MDHKAATTGRASQQTPRQRLVLLGASNLARGIGTLMQTARAAFDGPLDVMAALGHGRSFGRGSWVLGRWLPGIVDCHLWEDLAARDDDLPTAAVVTDVGNDILYGASTDQIVGWVETCVERLQQNDCRIALTGVPVESLQRIGRWEFPIFRSMLYPGCLLTREDALLRAAQLDDALRYLADDRGIHFIASNAQWYGRDRIHIARRCQREAWRAFLSELGEDEAAGGGKAARATWSEFLNIRRLTPHHRSIFGIPQRRAQPAGRLRDGTLVSLY